MVVRRVLTAASRSARDLAISRSSAPDSEYFRNPPPASICWNSFQVIRSARRIDGPIQPGFPLQDQLGVARQALRGFVRFAIGLIERLDLQRIGAADRRRHGLGAGAQQVHVRVVDGLGPVGRARADDHLGGALVGRVEAGDRTSPYRSGSAQLGNFKEIVGPDGERKHQRLSGIVSGESAVRKLCDDLHAFGKRESELLYEGRAGLGEAVGTNGDRAKQRRPDRADQAGGAVKVRQGFIIDRPVGNRLPG